jgi:protein SCO1/2
MRKEFKILVLIVLLILPVSIAIFLKSFGENEYALDIYYPDGVISTNTFCNYVEGQQHYIPNFNLLDQDSSMITQAKLEGNITVVSFFFTSCPTICPTMNSEMLRVQETFEGNKNIQLISFSVDPEHDIPSVLREYGERLGVNHNTWSMVTGPREDIYMLARCGFILPVEHGGNDPFEFIHSEKFILVDREKRIRGYYDGTSRKDIDRLIIEAQVLMTEYK